MTYDSKINLFGGKQELLSNRKFQVWISCDVNNLKFEFGNNPNFFTAAKTYVLISSTVNVLVFMLGFYLSLRVIYTWLCM